MPRVPALLCPLLAALVFIGFTAAPVYAHEVSPGETLSAIASRYGVGVTDLADANNIADVDLVIAGTVLTIPGAEAVHVVQPGDTLSAVAGAYGTGIATLVELNGLNNPHLIVVGQHLLVPGSSQAGLAAAAPPQAPPPAAYADVEAALVHWAWMNGVDPYLAQGLAWHESGWQQDVVSSTGAVGVMQLMPAAWEHIRSHLIGLPELDPFVMEDNVRMGVRYLRQLLVNFDGDERRAVAAYYQGERAVREWGIYPESEKFVDNVLANRDLFTAD